MKSRDEMLGLREWWRIFQRHKKKAFTVFLLTNRECRRYTSDDGVKAPKGLLAIQQGSRLLSPSQFQHRLELERMRSDRIRIPFTLLKLRLVGTCNGSRDGRHLLEQVEARVRATDEIGEWDGWTIALLLPDTPAEGAGVLASDLRSITGFDEAALQCVIYEYSCPEPDVPPPMDANRPRDRRSGAACAVSAEEMEPLFAKALPTWKRLFDIVAALVGCVFLSPILLLAALAVRCTTPGPALFRQRRSGLGGREFTILKFRTMYLDAVHRQTELMFLNEQDGPAFKIARDPRVTPIGRFLRRTCIDELPQLWNVLRGEMSLIGPRPLWVVEQNKCDGWQRRRLTITPGMTCTWQLYGGSDVPFKDWMRMDIRYIRLRSWRHDLRLLVETVISILHQNRV